MNVRITIITSLDYYCIRRSAEFSPSCLSDVSNKQLQKIFQLTQEGHIESLLHLSFSLFSSHPDAKRD